MESTLGKLARLAQLPNTVAKLTTVSANYSNEPWPHRDTWPAVRRVIDAFGAERCVWGSAFPQVRGKRLFLRCHFIRQARGKHRTRKSGGKKALFFPAGAVDTSQQLRAEPQGLH
jgi:hypothetical protein